MTVLTSPPPMNATTGAADLSSGLHELAGQDAWTDLGADGIVGDYTNTAWKVTPATGQTVNVGAVDDVVGLLNYRARISAAEVPNLATVGTQPVAGQQRLSRVVARLDRSNYVTRVVVVPGAPALSAVAPAVRNDNTFWDLPLARVLQRGTAAITAADITDERSWAGGHKELAPGAVLFGPVGCTRGREGVLWRRVPGSTPTWLNPGEVAQFQSGRVTTAATFVVGFDTALLVPAVTVPASPVPRVASLHATATVFDAGGAANEFEVGFRVYTVASGVRTLISDRAKRVRISDVGSGHLSRTVTLNPNTTYSFEWAGRTRVSGQVMRFEADTGVTYMEITTRGGG